MKRRGGVAGSVLVLCIAGVLGACKEPPATEPKVYRVGMEEIFLFSDFNPTAEYDSFAWGLYSDLLLRTLVGYPHVAGAAGNQLVPDLATDLGEVSEDGLTYTYHLKPGVRFGPPLDRPITSEDVLYAFRRIDTAGVSDGGPGFYFDGIIEGMEGPQEQMPATISGIETPDEQTIVFHLTQPTGDFPYRLAMPVAAPMPEEFASCFEGNDYGKHLVASGPYMFAGSDDADPSSCSDLDPWSGYDPEEALIFVKNPSYDPATDSLAAREAHVDRFEFRAVEGDRYALLEAGELESLVGPRTDAATIARYQGTAALQDRLHIQEGDTIWYAEMNLTQPPFDDVHVRKAVNLVVNKTALHTAWGGSTAAQIATHVVPPGITGGHPTASEYDPFATAGFAGDLEAAKAEMRLSAYDADDDGLCDAAVCQDVRHVTRDVSPWTEIASTLEANLATIGIDLATEALPAGEAYGATGDVTNPVPFASNAAWGKDYADAGTFIVPLFDGGGIGFCCNSSLVGLTEAVASELAIPGTVTGIPSVDDDIDACAVVTDPEDRIACWVDIDERITGEIVPWVPMMWANRVDIVGAAVTQYDFDQFSGLTAYAHVDVDPDLQQ